MADLRTWVYRARMLWKILKKDTVGASEIAQAYGQIAETYDHWTAKMGSYLDLIMPEKIDLPARPVFLDLACGTGEVAARLIRRYAGSRVVGVDLSLEMIQKARQRIQSDRLELVNQEAIAYLQGCAQRFDGAWVGWAYPYLHAPSLHAGLARVVKPGGLCGILSNRRGTLGGIVQSIQRLMEQYPDRVARPMVTQLHLPTLTKLSLAMKKAGFSVINEGHGEHSVLFEKPEQLLDWVRKTGAIAGTDSIFNRFDADMEKTLVKLIGKACEKSGGFGTEHAFLYGIYRKGGQS